MFIYIFLEKKFLIFFESFFLKVFESFFFTSKVGMVTVLFHCDPEGWMEGSCDLFVMKV